MERAAALRLLVAFKLSVALGASSTGGLAPISTVASTARSTLNANSQAQPLAFSDYRCLLNVTTLDQDIFPRHRTMPRRTS